MAMDLLRDQPLHPRSATRRAILASGVATAAFGAPAAAASGDSDGRSRAAAEVAQRHRSWIFRWDRTPGDGTFEFDASFADLYDFAAEGPFYDDFAPEDQTAYSPSAYGDIFEPIFNSLVSAEHVILREPQALVSGSLATSHMVFGAALTAGSGSITRVRTNSTLGWRRHGSTWRIVREHNSSVILPPA